MNARQPKKPLMRSLGEFFGHIVNAVRSHPGGAETEAGKKTIRKSVEEKEERGVILRRTTIEEIEVPKSADDARH